MAAFDLNSLYFIKNAAPKTTSFEEAIAPMRTGFDLGTAYNASYNRNSLQNLIAQREKEGIPYDRLSNEAAKWDLGAANGMRNERRASMEYNYKQSLAEFEQWRKNMARRICGLILQKADELNIPEEELHRVLNVAASYVVTYDEALAQWLLGQAQLRRYNQGRLNKPSTRNEDESKLYPSEISARKGRANDVDLSGANRFLGVYQENSANVGAMLSNFFTTGRLPWLKKAWIDGVTRYAMQVDPEKFGENDIWDAKKIEDAINLYMSSLAKGDVSDETPVEPETSATPAAPDSPAKPSTPKAPSAPVESDYKNEIRSYYIPGNAKAGYRENLNVKKVDADLKKYNDNIEALEYMLGVLASDNQKFAGVKGDASGNSENAVVKVNREKVQKRIDELKELDKGGFSPKNAKTLKLNGKSAAQQTAEAAKWQRIPTLISGYYTNPGALLPAMVRAILPEERTTDQDVKRVLASDLGSDMYSKLWNAIAASDDSMLGTLLKQEGFEQAIRSVAPVVMDKMISEYKSLVKSNNGNEKDVDEALMEVYNFDNEVLDYLKGVRILQKDKARYESIKKKKQQENEEKERKAYEREMGGGDGSVISARDWLNQRRGKK